MNKLTSNKILLIFIIINVILSGFCIAYGVVSVVGLITVLAFMCLLLIISDMTQNKHSILRNFPLIGRLRWVFESERSKIQQYFIEDDTNGTPFNREKRADVYQKAKNDVNTTPFGTQLDVYASGYEYLKHSMYPIAVDEVPEPRVTIGSNLCSKPYSASIVNISAMSYGALSDAAVRALNGGASMGNFYHNTGEGSISPYHMEHGGDLCFQIGTGYFGCGITNEHGAREFSNKKFMESLHKANVKMVEIKLSQGAKPGHGGILPASKNSKEIAEIRGVEPHTDVMSPPYHSAFHDELGLINFIMRLRELSDGLPIGIKMCLGSEREFINLIRLMNDLNTYPDFITIDGGEGGTGAAPIVFTNHIGTPLIDALKFVDETLINFRLRDKITLIASGKATSSFDVIKLLSLGADTVNIARGFMLSLGCIQARECNKNTCPVGIATQDKTLIKGLDSNDKKVRVYNYHKNLIHEIREVMAAMGISSTEKLNSDSITTNK